MSMDSRRHAPAAERNRAPIADVLAEVLHESGTLLEVSSGTGQHTAHFAARFSAWQFQPSELLAESLPSIDAWAADSGVSNIRPGVVLDVTAPVWPLTGADAVFNANMIHIAPWECCLGLMAGAGRVLSTGAPLVTYGPYKLAGAHTAESNERFDASLRARDASWGVRDLEQVEGAAQEQGLELERKVAMPANNFMLIFRKTS